MPKRIKVIDKRGTNKGKPRSREEHIALAQSRLDAVAEMPLGAEVMAGLLARTQMLVAARGGASSYGFSAGPDRDSPIGVLYVVVNPQHAGELKTEWDRLSAKWEDEGAESEAAGIVAPEAPPCS